MSFASDLETFKRMVSKFLAHCANGVRGDALNESFKCVVLHYIYMEGSDAERQISVGYMEYAMRRKADIALDERHQRALMVSPYIRKESS